MSETTTAAPVSQAAHIESSGTGFAARMGAKVRGLKDQLKAITTERDALSSQLGNLTKERDQLASRADTSATAKELDKLKQQLRVFHHKQAFDGIAAKAGVRPEAMADAWTLSGYTPDADEPEEAKLNELVNGLKEKRGYLFGDSTPPTPPAQGGAAVTPPRPGPATGQGGGTGPGAPVFSNDLAKTDVAYVMKNYDQYVAAAKAGTFR